MSDELFEKHDPKHPEYNFFEDWRENNDPEYQLALAMARDCRQLMRDLIEARKRKWWSQKDVAAALGIPVEKVERFEAYDSNPKLTMVRRYAQVGGVRVTFSVEHTG